MLAGVAIAVLCKIGCRSRTDAYKGWQMWWPAERSSRTGNCSGMSCLHGCHGSAQPTIRKNACLAALPVRGHSIEVCRLRFKAASSLQNVPSWAAGISMVSLNVHQSLLYSLACATSAPQTKTIQLPGDM